MKRRTRSKWPAASLGMQGALLAMEAQQVIALRLAKLAVGGPRAQREAALMVSEKMAALAESQLLMLRAAGQGRSAAGAKKVMGLYRRKVGANRRRLSKGHLKGK